MLPDGADPPIQGLRELPARQFQLECVALSISAREVLVPSEPRVSGPWG